MTLETVPFDAAEYLDTPESQIELLADALESGDAGYLANAIGAVARARGMTDIAREAGIPRAALFDALLSGSEPNLAMLRDVARALRLKAHAQPVS
jgi:probable addiction module antidote protein